MNPCPFEARVLRLLGDDVPPEERDELEGHLDDCDACRETLVGGAGDLRLSEWRRHRKLVDGKGAFQAFIDRLIDLPYLARGEAAPERAGGSSEAAPLVELPGYELIRSVGRGGMGVVYEARQLGLGRTVAIKVIAAGWTDALVRERFRREVIALARLHHPHIVGIHDAGEHLERPYLVMEWVEGGSLADRLSQEVFAPREAAELVIAIASALQCAHEQGIVHRDLKPSNVLLGRAGPPADGAAAAPRFFPKISDFGLVKLVEDDNNATASGMILGTPSYMAPEQTGLLQEPVGPAADVYGLGAIFYEMLTGRPPFKGLTPLQTIVLAVNEDVIAPRAFRPDLPVDLETICLKCLEQHPGRRYHSAADLAEDLERFLAGRPIQARPTPLPERVVKWGRRNPALAALALVGMLAVGAAAAGGAFYVRSMHAAMVELASEKARADGALEAKARAFEAQARANALTRDALDAVTDEVMNRLIARRPSLGREEREFVRRIRELYETMGRDLGSAPEALRLRAAGRLRTGRMLLLIDELKEAEDVLRKALDDVEQLQAAGSEGAKHPGLLSDVLSQLVAALWRQGRIDEAEAALRRRLTLLESPEADGRDWGRRLALGYGDLSELIAVRGDSDGRERAARRSVELFRPLVEEAPSDLGLRLDYAWAHYHLGKALVAQKRLDEAEECFLAMKSMGEKIQAQSPDPTPARRVRIHALEQLFHLMADQGRLEEALPLQNDRADLARESARANPENPRIQADLFFILHVGARAMWLNHRPQAAWPWAREAAEVSARIRAAWPTDFEFADNHAQIHRLLGAMHADGGAIDASAGAYDEAARAVAPWLEHSQHAPAARAMLTEIHRDRADHLAAAGRVPDAAVDLRKALDYAAPNPDPRLKVHLGMLLALLGDPSGAAALMDEVDRSRLDGEWLLRGAEVLALLASHTSRDPDDVACDVSRAVRCLALALERGVPRDVVERRVAGSNFRTLHGRAEVLSLVRPPGEEEGRKP